MTHSNIAYHCANCGNYIDLCILKNRGLTLEERNETAHKRHGYHVTNPDTFTISSAGHVLLASSGVSDLW